MLNKERRGSGDRRKAEPIHSQSQFLTQAGVVFSDRRTNSDRRNLKTEEMLEFGEVEEIELKPVRCV